MLTAVYIPTFSAEMMYWGPVQNQRDEERVQFLAEVNPAFNYFFIKTIESTDIFEDAT